jgi:hypothetical protein
MYVTLAAGFSPLEQKPIPCPNSWSDTSEILNDSSLLSGVSACRLPTKTADSHSSRTLIGVAKTCHNMRELRDKMAEMYGKSRVQLTLYLPSNKSLTFPQ